MCDQQSYPEPAQSGHPAPLPGSTAGIPDIFDVLAGGEDEGTVRYLLGYQEANGGLMEGFTSMETEPQGEHLPLCLAPPYITLPGPACSIQQEQQVAPARSPVVVRPAQPSDCSSNKKRDTSGTKAIHNCDSCGKSFTTKFNLKRHINMHCHKSKEAGVPIQGPPSASAPAKKDLGGVVRSPLQTQQQRPPNTNMSWATGNTTNHVLQYPDLTNNNSAEYSMHHSSASRLDYSSLAAAEPDSTYRLPSVQTLLPISTVYTLAKPGYTSSQPLLSCPPFPSPPSLCSPPAPGQHNTDYGSLPADLFEPDSSESCPPSPSRGDWCEASSLPSSPSSPLIMLTAVPPGWSRRVVLEQGVPSAKYFSPLGKRFSCYEEVASHFDRQKYSVPRHLFTFSVEEDMEGEGSSESDLADSEAESEEQNSAKRRRRESSLGEEEAGVAPPCQYSTGVQAPPVRLPAVHSLLGSPTPTQPSAPGPPRPTPVPSSTLAPTSCWGPVSPLPTYTTSRGFPGTLCVTGVGNSPAAASCYPTTWPSSTS